MIKKLLLTLCFCLITSVSFGALVEGTNCGFVTSAPSSDPNGDRVQTDTWTFAFKTTSPSNAISIIEIGWWCDGQDESGAGNWQGGLYDHNAGDNNPEALLYNTGDQAKGTDGGIWKKATVDWDISGSTVYWLAVQLDNTTPDTYGMDITYDVSYLYHAQRDWTSLVNPWGTSYGTATRLITIYVVYTTSGGAERRAVLIR